VADYQGEIRHRIKNGNAGLVKDIIAQENG